MKKKIIIAGANGLVGQKLLNSIDKNHSVLALDLQSESKTPDLEQVRYLQFDITDYNKVKELFLSFKPDYVINAAAFTNVDGCEIQRDLSWKVNVTAPKYLAELSRRYGAHLTHISSDYIFDGKNGPYREEDSPNPLSYYGEQKLSSEKEVLSAGCRNTIFRGIVIYGHAREVNLNFATWLYGELSAGRKINVVTDQWGNTTLAEDVATGILSGIAKDAEGIFHLGNGHFHSRYDFTLEFAKYFKFDPDLVNPVLTKNLKQKANRPLRSGLNIDKIKGYLGFEPTELVNGFSLFKKQVKNG